MNQKADFGDPAYRPAEILNPERTGIGVWEKVKLVVSRAIFWSYDRGSWQYDIIVLLILGFIFLSPKRWFHDRPQLQLADVRHLPGIVELGHGRDSWTFQIDARLVPVSNGAKAEQSIRKLLQPRLRSSFTIVSVAPIHDGRGVVLGYNVVVRSP